MKRAWQILFRFILGYLVTIGVIAVTQWTYYNYLDQYELPILVEPIKILNPGHEIAIGEEIMMRLEIEKPDDVTVKDRQVNITCQDGNLITLLPSERSGTIQTGQFEIISSSYIMPAKASPGSICQFNFINVYQPNPYKEEIRTWKSEWFTVRA